MDSIKLLTLFNMMSQCDSIKRYSRDKISNPESVLTHVGWCSLFCTVVGNYIESLNELTINYGLLLKRAILHDIDECGTGDVPRTTKYSTREVREQLAVVEKKFIKLIEDQLGLERNSIYEPWSSAKNDSTIEGVLMKYADLMSVVYKIWDEIIISNNYGFSRVAIEVYDVLTNTNLKPDWLKDSPKTYEWFTELDNSMIETIKNAIDIIDNRKSLGSISFKL